MGGNDLEKRIEALERENLLLDSKILELYTLYNISKRLILTTQIEEIFDGAMDLISNSLNIEDFCIMLLDDTKQNLVVQAFHGDSDLKDISFSLDEGITGKAVARGESTLIPDVSQEPDFLFYKGKKKNIGSFLSVPLIGKAGNILGALNVHKPEVNSFGGVDKDLFEEVAGQIAAALDKAISFKRVRDLSLRDELTGLFNRRYFFDFFEKELERSNRYDRPASIIILDIDHFKNFNDTNGHLMGDDALKAIARVLNDNVRKVDVVARFGGEEFIVVLPETDKDMAVNVAEKLRIAIENEKIEGEENQPGGNLTATFGVSSLPEDAGGAAEMVDCADKALYRGKAKKRNVVIPYVHNGVS